MAIGPVRWLYPRPPNCTNTMFAFDLPYAIPVPDGAYQVRQGNLEAEVTVGRVQRKEFDEWKTGGDRSLVVQLGIDKRGLFSYSSIEITFHTVLDLEEEGNKSELLQGHPRLRHKETALRVLNRFIETVRQVTGLYWIEPIRYQDILSYEIFYSDGEQRYPGGHVSLEPGAGEVRVGFGSAFDIEEGKLNEIHEILKNDVDLDLCKTFWLKARDAFLKEDYRLSIVEAVTALEVMLSRFIRKHYRRIKKPVSMALRSYQIYRGLSRKIDDVLPIVKQALEVDDNIVRGCKTAVRLRNKILHEGRRSVTFRESESSLVALDKITEYLASLVEDA